MQYEYRYYKVFDPPTPLEPTPQETTITVTCISGIVGDSYGFEKSDNFDMVVQNADTLEAIYSQIEAACVQFVSDNYPNT